MQRRREKLNPAAGRQRLLNVARRGLLAVGCGGVTLFAASSAQAAGAYVRVGSVPKLPAGSTPLASAASVTSMQVTVTLKPRNVQALAAYAQAVSNPASASYRRYLTVAQFRQRFAPSGPSLRKIEAALRAAGLKTLTVTANGLAIEVKTTNAAVERAFKIQLASVRTKTGTDVVYNAQAPAFAASIAQQINGVIGLNGFDHKTANAEFAKPTKAQSARLRADTATTKLASSGAVPSSTCASAINATSAAGYGYTADEIASAYGFANLYASGDYGRGQTIALYELEPNLASDIDAYQACYGTDAAVQYVKVDGGAGSTSNGYAGYGEATLDIEQAIGLAPEANILVYQGPNSNSNDPGSGPYDTMAKIISQNRASVVSTSWGDCEAAVGQVGLAAEYYLFEEAAVQGQTILSAAGDDGSEDCYGISTSYTGLAVDDPGSQPLVTSVGGTSLKLTSSTRTETVWNDGAASSDGGAGGGGVSTCWLMPDYQRLAASSLNVMRSSRARSNLCGGGNSYRREVPDVSASADENHGYFVYFSGANTSTSASAGGTNGWQVVGGTSAAAPLWAALVAEANAESSCQSRRIGMLNSELYRLASKSQSTYFSDVTSGNNDMLSLHGGRFAAGAGYDMASGLGTPIASALAPALCGSELTLTTPGNRFTFLNSKVRMQLHAKMVDGSPARITYSSSGLPKGLKLNAKTGVISGRPRAASIRTVTVMARTGDEVLRTIQFRWTIERRPKVSSVKLTDVVSGRPELSLVATAGLFEPGFTELTVTLPTSLHTTGALAAIHLYAGGKLLKAEVTSNGQAVRIVLGRRQRVVAVRFGNGSLRSSRALIAAAKRSMANVRILVVELDAAGGSSRIARNLALS